MLHPVTTSCLKVGITMKPCHRGKMQDFTINDQVVLSFDSSEQHVKFYWILKYNTTMKILFKSYLWEKYVFYFDKVSVSWQFQLEKFTFMSEYYCMAYSHNGVTGFCNAKELLTMI